MVANDISSELECSTLLASEWCSIEGWLAVAIERRILVSFSNVFDIAIGSHFLNHEPIENTLLRRPASDPLAQPPSSSLLHFTLSRPTPTWMSLLPIPVPISASSTEPIRRRIPSI